MNFQPLQHIADFDFQHLDFPLPNTCVKRKPVMWHQSELNTVVQVQTIIKNYTLATRESGKEIKSLEKFKFIEEHG